ncbi:hypothetical protein F4808DRAFT_66202 [Astrocystis sublimbata]|nr:hypothetical protein F4808DRAFT_66202 [Astrocystis sublimbata]
MASLNSGDDAPLVESIGERLFKVTISRKNSVSLFSEAVQKLIDNREEAELILRNLRAWSPQAAAFFNLRTPELVYNVPFRLICESDTGGVPFDDERVLRQYLAVSYCWRPEDGSWPGLNVPAYTPWPISRPFVEAILAQRGIVTSDSNDRNENFRREGIWLDQMCIQQDDRDEKVQAIAMMDIIYKSCRKLLIVMEDVAFEPEEIEILQRCEAITAGRDITRWQPLQGEAPHIASMVRKIESSRWWSRSWCWHEFEINEPWSDHRSIDDAYGALMIVGDTAGGTYTLKFSDYFRIRGSVEFPNPYSKEDFERDFRWVLMSNLNSPYLDPNSRGEGAERSSILARFNAASTGQCLYPDDLISISLNVSNIALFYSVPLAVRAELKEKNLGGADSKDAAFFISAICLAAGETTPLTSVASSREMIQYSEKGDKTSWLSSQIGKPDAVNIARFSLGSIKFVHEMYPSNIKLDLVFFELPMVNTTEAEVDLSLKFFPETPIRSIEVAYKEKHRGGPRRRKWWGQSTDKDEFWDQARRLFFVSACKNGLQYIFHLWDGLEKQLVQKSFFDSLAEPFAVDESNRTTAEKLLEHLSPDDAHNKENLDILVKFISFIKDPRSNRMLSVLRYSRIKCNNEAGVAIVQLQSITKGFPFSSERRRLAIPRDMLGMPWEAYRVWILEPYHIPEGGNSKNHAGLLESHDGLWVLVGKMQCLGDVLVPSPSNDDETSPSVSLKTHQMVVGGDVSGWIAETQTSE